MSNTLAAGISGIGYQLIKWAHDCRASLICDLMNACVGLSHHPLAWREAAIVVIPKPRKADMAAAKSYRPIALLETWSKWLKKLIASRIHKEIGALDLVPHLQFGGRMRSGTNDAGLTLVHDVKRAMDRQKYLVTIAFDVKGFFDNINHARMVHTLRIMGFAEELVGWAGSFLQDRRVAFRLGDFRSESMTIGNVGVPQGSPLSPPLAALYTSHCWPTWETIPCAGPQCYVDDGLVKVEHNSSRAAKEAAASLVLGLEHRLNALGLQIDHGDKLEMMIFGTKRMLNSADRSPIALTHPDGSVSSLKPLNVWRYLGIHFTPTLNWEMHVNRQCNKTIAMAKALRMVANCTRGLTTEQGRILFNSILLPVLLYAVPVYLTGVNQKGLVKKLQVAQNEGVRWVLGAFRTTSVRDMHHLAAIPPVAYTARKLRIGAAIRLNTLPARGEISKRLQQAAAEDGVTTSLTLLPLPLQHLDETVTPFAALPLPNRLSVKLPRANLDETERKAYEKSLLAEVKAAANSKDALAMFSDGSRKFIRHTKRAGCGSVLVHQNKSTDFRFKHLGCKHTIYDAELMGLAMGMVTAARYIRHHPGRVKQLVLSADNQAAVGTITDTSDHPGQRFSRLFRLHADQILTEFPDLSISVIWARGHAGLRWNEKADWLANEGAEDYLDSVLEGASLSLLKERNRAQVDIHRQRDYRDIDDLDRKDAPLSLRKSLPSRRLSQEIQVILEAPWPQSARAAQVLLGHAFVGEFYGRHVPTKSTACECGVEMQATKHVLFTCPALLHTPE
jgi:ribonuclease HI